MGKRTNSKSGHRLCLFFLSGCYLNSSITRDDATKGSLGENVVGGDGSLSAVIPEGYYSGNQIAVMRDSDLISENIRLGIDIFGVVGTYFGGFGSNMSSLQHRDRSFTPIDLYTEFVTNAGSSYSNSSTGYRVVPSILKDSDGTAGSTYVYVDRTDWGTLTCGT